MSFATNDSATRHSAGVAITAEEIAAGEQKASDDVARYALALGDDALMLGQRLSWWISRAPDLGFGYEEALGYCVDPDMVRDKDGITAALMAAELAAALTAQGRGLTDALADVDAVTGAMPSAQVSVRVADLSLIARTMTALRQQAPATLAGEPVTVRRDLAAGGDGLPPTDALLFATDSGTRVLVRPSGTEPVIRVMAEGDNRDLVAQVVDDVVDALA